MECITGKQILDKKGAITLKNLTMELHHIKMKIYPCGKCKGWHLGTIGPRHGKFRHGKL